MIVSFFISKNRPPLAIDTDISIPVSDVFFCRPPGHSLKGVLRCSVFSKTFKTCWFPLYFIYRHFSRIALAIIWCWFFQHSLTAIKVAEFRGQSTENRWQRTKGKRQIVSVFCHLTSVFCYLTKWCQASNCQMYGWPLRQPWKGSHGGLPYFPVFICPLTAVFCHLFVDTWHPTPDT